MEQSPAGRDPATVDGETRHAIRSRVRNSKGLRRQQFKIRLSSRYQGGEIKEDMPVTIENSSLQVIPGRIIRILDTLNGEVG